MEPISIQHGGVFMHLMCVFVLYMEGRVQLCIMMKKIIISEPGGVD